MDRPLVSVIVAAYNAEPFIEATLESVFAQTMSDFELIVVDDGSSDATLSRVRRFQDPRLQVIRQENKGAPSALNTGLKAARGSYVGLLDHDDIWRKDKLARHVVYFEAHPEVDATFSWSALIDERGNETGIHSRRWEGAISFRELLLDFVVGNTSAIMLRSATVDEVGGFDATALRYYDMELLMRVALLRSGNVRAVPEELTLYRRHPGQMSRDWRAMRQNWSEMVSHFRVLSAAETASVEDAATSNMQRYFAWLAYEEGEHEDACRLLWEGFRVAPGVFVKDARNWKVGLASLAGVVLPATLHQALEGMAGIALVRNQMNGGNGHAS
jgi:glycosyltransferase involved in cell wall biosynthesis